MYGNKKNFGMQKKMNIVISCDDNYIMPARIMLESLAAYNTDVSLWIVYSEIKDQNIKKIENDADNYKWDFHSIRINDSIRKIAESLPCNMHFSKEMYYRLFLPWILTECEKVLYLDCDMMVRGRLDELYKMDCNENLVAATCDVNTKIQEESIKRLELQGKYHNSGMQLIHLKRIRERMSIEQMAFAIKENVDTIQLVYPDQDLFNKIYDKKIEQVGEIYNYGATTNILHKLRRPGEVKKAVIVHFVSNYKPWHNDYCSFYVLEYWKYLKKYLSKEQQKDYWKHKRFIKAFMDLTKGYILRKIGVIGYTDSLIGVNEFRDN